MYSNVSSVTWTGTTVSPSIIGKLNVPISEITSAFVLGVKGMK
jgi:hypothetical protein